MVIYFIRHGDPNYKEDCLTEKGREQAALLAERVRHYKLDEVYYSPYGRARETGEACMKYFDIEPVTKEWLKEIEWGDLSGDPYSNASPWALSYEFQQKRHSYPAGDSWKDEPVYRNDRLVADVERRIACFDEFMAEHGLIREGQGYLVTEKAANRTIAIFAHGGVFSALVSHLLNIPFLQFVSHFDVEVTGILKLYFNESGEYTVARARFLNDFHHIAR